MSYDLYFRPPAPVDPDAIHAHFQGRTGVSMLPGQVDYNNTDTGVHFMIDFGPPEPGEDADDPLKDTQATLLLNYVRPTPFAREAAAEAAALAAAFDMQVIDPQADDTLRPFDADRFVADYITTADGLVARTLSSNNIPAPHRLPRATLDTMWDWNRQKDDRYQALGEDLFIPTLTAFSVDGTTRTGVVFGDGVPMCLPRVDGVFLLRRDLAPTKGLLRRRTEDADWVDFDTFITEFGDLFVHSDRFGGTYACKEADQPELRGRVAERDSPTARPMTEVSDHIALLGFSNVLDAEYFA